MLIKAYSLIRINYDNNKKNTVSIHNGEFI